MSHQLNNISNKKWKKKKHENETERRPVYDFSITSLLPFGIPYLFPFQSYINEVIQLDPINFNSFFFILFFLFIY